VTAAGSASGEVATLPGYGHHRDLNPVVAADLGQQTGDVGLGGRQADEEVGEV
jgi:hypothetical protein